MHEVLVNRLGGLSLPRKSVARLTDHLDMTLDVYRGRKTTTQQQQQIPVSEHIFMVPEVQAIGVLLYNETLLNFSSIFVSSNIS